MDSGSPDGLLDARSQEVAVSKAENPRFHCRPGLAKRSRQLQMPHVAICSRFITPPICGSRSLVRVLAHGHLPLTDSCAPADSPPAQRPADSQTEPDCPARWRCSTGSRATRKCDFLRYLEQAHSLVRCFCDSRSRRAAMTNACHAGSPAAASDSDLPAARSWPS